MNKKNTNVVMAFEDKRDGLDNKASVGLVPYGASEEVRQSVNDLRQEVRDTLRIPPSEWPRGRRVVFSLEFQVVPKKIKASIEEAE